MPSPIPSPWTCIGICRTCSHSDRRGPLRQGMRLTHQGLRGPCLGSFQSFFWRNSIINAPRDSSVGGQVEVLSSVKLFRSHLTGQWTRFLKQRGKDLQTR
jgi:hypothetical protein